MMGSHAWHGKAPNDAQLESALSQFIRNRSRLLILLNLINEIYIYRKKDTRSGFGAGLAELADKIQM
jgi:hypothetical protein